MSPRKMSTVVKETGSEKEGWSLASEHQGRRKRRLLAILLALVPLLTLIGVGVVSRPVRAANRWSIATPEGDTSWKQGVRPPSLGSACATHEVAWEPSSQPPNRASNTTAPQPFQRSKPNANLRRA